MHTAAAHVVRLPIAREHHLVLTPDLHQSDETDDLPFRDVGQSIPRGRCRHSWDGVCNGIALRADAERVDDESAEAKHRDAPVLDLRFAKKANSCCLALAPEILVRKLERIPVANNCSG